MTMATNNNKHPTSCPCKTITWSLSSFTAAEYGDVTALSQALSKGSTRRQSDDDLHLRPGIQSGGITPLHLAAQHGHVAATWVLLEKGYPPDGDEGGSCTPLHRASFSGATATMRLLLETKKVDLLARDTSFGDQRTPLHKAAAGGRYLAVALLIDALQQQQNEEDGTGGGGSSSSILLENALKARDRNQETPLDVAKAYQKKNQVEERQSVARWDAVAGDTVASWDKCVAILAKAERETIKPNNSMVQQPVTTTAVVCSTKQQQQQLWWQLPRHQFGTKMVCFGCEGGDGECVTDTWSAEFQKALQRSVSIPQEEVQAPENLKQEEQLWKRETMETDSTSKNIHLTNSTTTLEETKKTTMTNPPLPESTTPMGRACVSCGVSSFVLFATPRGLVCKKCKRKKKKMNS